MIGGAVLAGNAGYNREEAFLRGRTTNFLKGREGGLYSIIMGGNVILDDACYDRGSTYG